MLHETQMRHRKTFLLDFVLVGALDCGVFPVQVK